MMKPLAQAVAMGVTAFASLAAAIIVPAAGAKSAETSSAGAEIRLVEFVPWLIKNAGPEKAKGVVYFARGWGQFRCCRNRDDFRLVPYFLKGLSDNGWDVLAAKIPEGPRTERAHDAVEGGAAFLKRRVRELKAEGYKSVVLGGHSWGGWLTLVAAQDPALAADSLIVSSPSTYGPDTIPSGPRQGSKNPDHMRNWSEFQALVQNISRPTVMILMKEDPFEPAADRGLYAHERLRDKDVIHLIINKPLGFNGHSGAWLPVFDLMYGQCIRHIIDLTLRPTACKPRPLSQDAFASYFSMTQVSSLPPPKSLIGKAFAAYTLDDSMRHYDYPTETERLNMYSLDQIREAYELREGRHCVKDKCSVLVQWDEERVLEFDAATGKLAAWWIAH